VRYLLLACLVSRGRRWEGEEGQRGEGGKEGEREDMRMHDVLLIGFTQLSPSPSLPLVLPPSFPGSLRLKTDCLSSEACSISPSRPALPK